MPLSQTFDAVYCLNLDRRPDRWERFRSQIPSDWPFAHIQRVAAVDGRQVPPPDWWKSGRGAWGCYRSHLMLIENALNAGLRSILLLEDDALFCQDFSRRAAELLNAVPDDWGMLYLGGQHLLVNREPPQAVNEHVFRPYNVNRTHAFALRGPLLAKVYHHLLRPDWRPRNHIDHHLGRLHQRREDPIYCPGSWLVGQAEGQSNISGRQTVDRFWAHAAEIDRVDVQQQPFVAVLGLHSSGSSCLAGVLHHLGLHLGNELTGYYGNSPESNACGFEAVGLRKLCERAIPFPATEFACGRIQVERELRHWINQKRREAAARGTIAAGKYPQLCQLGAPLLDICGEQLRVIVSDRPVSQSVESLRRREPQLAPDRLSDHQAWLQAGKEWLLGQLAESQKLVVSYERLLADPAREAARIVRFLNRTPSEAQIGRILEWVDQGKQHVRDRGDRSGRRQNGASELLAASPAGARQGVTAQ